MLPLEGIKVIDLSTWIFAPSCAAALGDWGAEVIKIEHPETGDDFRWFYVTFDIDDSDVPVTLFGLDNRNKRGMAFDLKQPEGRDILYKLVEDADIFLSNFPRTVLENLKLDHGRLSAINQRLIYAHATGYGEEGSDTSKPGYDATACWARSGLMAALANGGPTPVHQPIAGPGDHASGLAFFGGVLLALYNREKTGKGQQVDLSLLGVGTCLTSSAIQFAMSMGEEPPLWPREECRNPLVNHYRTKDCAWLYLTCLPDEPYWVPLCKAIGREDLEEDPRFRTRTDRLENNIELVSLLDNAFALKTKAEWTGLLNENGIIWTYVPMSFEEVANDPQMTANDHIVEVEHPEFGPTKIMTNPIRLNKEAPPIRMLAPEIGQHNEEILLEMNYTWEEIAELQEKGILP